MITVDSRLCMMIVGTYCAQKGLTLEEGDKVWTKIGPKQVSLFNSVSASMEILEIAVSEVLNEKEDARKQAIKDQAIG